MRQRKSFTNENFELDNGFIGKELTFCKETFLSHTENTGSYAKPFYSDVATSIQRLQLYLKIKSPMKY